MLRLALQNVAHAGATNPLRAGHLDLDPYRGQRLDDGLPLGNLDRLAATCRHHFKAAAAGIHLHLKVLMVDMIFGIAQATSGIDDAVHETLRPAQVYVGTCLPLTQNSGSVDTAALFTEVGMHAGREVGLFQFVDESAATARTSAVVQLEFAVAGAQRMGHGDHRGDADAAADEDRTPGGLSQGEQVAWLADLDAATLVQAVVDRHGTASGGRILEHAQAVVGDVCGVATQGILAYQAGSDMQVDMSAGLELRQPPALRVGQLENDHTAALFFALAYHDFHQLLTHLQASFNFITRISPGPPAPGEKHLLNA
ncbi:hypothetical protein D3C78_964800 [compost metagenome]